MREAERQAYQRELRSAAKRLGLTAQGDIEEALIRRATAKVDEWISAHGQPKNLTELLQGIATSYRLEVVEIHSDEDLQALLTRIPPTQEPALARLADELNDRTDAVILQRQNRKAWEMPYLAIINCRGWHAYRKYFSKWHEVVHLFLDGAQLRFAFRTTSTEKKHPEEILVDKIAGVLAFHPALFQPALEREIAINRRLTLEGIERVRQAIAPDASREATLNACMRGCSYPVYFLKAKKKYKRAEEQQLTDLLSGVTDDEVKPRQKLRIDMAKASPHVQSLGIRMHENVEVPESSLVAAAFSDPGHHYRGREPLDIWRTSQGPLGYGATEIEAIGRGNEVSCLMRFLPGTRGSKAASARMPGRTGRAQTIEIIF